MAYPALSVANAFLALAARDGLGLDPMKLQKLMYYANGWHLAFERSPLVAEQVEAWKYGPVIASVYHHFKAYGSQPITTRATDAESASRRDITPPDDPTANEIIQSVWDAYKSMTGIQLSNLTHRPGTAWDRVRQELGGNVLPEAAPIPDDYIREEFEARREEAAAA